jgi:hypothetical protein
MSFSTQHIYKSATSSHSKPGLFGTTTLTLLLPWFVNVFAWNSRTRSSADSRIGPCFPAGSCMSTRLSPEQGLHQIPESAVLRSSGYRQLRFRASACSWLRLLAESRFPNSHIREFETSQVSGFWESRIPCSWKTCFENFVNLNVSRVTGFPEFPNTLKHFRGEWLGVHYEVFTKACKAPITHDSYSSGRTITLPSGQHLSKVYYSKRVGLYPCNPKPPLFLSDKAIR